MCVCESVRARARTRVHANACASACACACACACAYACALLHEGAFGYQISSSPSSTQHCSFRRLLADMEAETSFRASILTSNTIFSPVSLRSCVCVRVYVYMFEHPSMPACTQTNMCARVSARSTHPHPPHLHTHLHGRPSPRPRSSCVGMACEALALKSRQATALAAAHEH